MRGLILPLLMLVACAGDKGDATPSPTTDEPTTDTDTDNGVDTDTGTPPVTDTGLGLLGDGLANPYPSQLLVDPDGHLAIPADALPSGGLTLHPTERVAWRTGFSSAQTAVVRGLAVDAVGLPAVDSGPGEGSVRMADLTAGTWLPVMAELDAFPEASPPALLVRPLTVLPDGHDIAVVVTTEATARPERFQALVDGAPPASLVSYQPTHDALMADLTQLGIDEAEVALAWSFPVDRGVQPVPSALEQREAHDSYTLAVDAAPTTPLTWRAGTGTYTVTDFLLDDRSLVFGEAGSVVPQGTVEASLYVHVPASVADAPEGTVPVLVFGHGIFARPELYLAEEDDPSGVLALADELGAIVVGTTWRGLTTADLLGAAEVAADFGRFHEVPDRLVQAQVNVRTLIDLVNSGQIVDHPDLVGASGQSLADPDRVLYYGISLGGIAGSVMWAQDPPIEQAVFHVGGAMWSTMLERSSNFPLFEAAVVRAVPEPADRQVLYSFSQLFWDPVDPMSWATELSARDFLLQEAIGDEQVPNMTTEALARALQLPLLDPSATQPYGLSLQPAPLSRGLSQFDPGKPLPPPTNRPAPTTEAHTTPRLWPGHRQQTNHFLLTGEVAHFCGAAACTDTNPGTP